MRLPLPCARAATDARTTNQVRLEAAGTTRLGVLAPPPRRQRLGLRRAAITLLGYPHRKSADGLHAERVLAAGQTGGLR